MTAEFEKDGTLILKQRASLPDLLDVLIVGGGPAGTAAAFRAKELGLRALVIDFDDLMKRIRDYPKDKLILPSFGGGDRMKFPLGGDLIARLHFPDIDKDDMCESWKGYYRDFNVPAKVGVELTGLHRGDDGWWTAATWNHLTKAQETFRARYVVLAPGRGVPRRFDIPGNTEGIAYRLDDPATYVEGPVCVIGGGTSAAEAVIAISNAKVLARNECDVVWSYRGSKMPRVSKALADVFFTAYMDNGNIRYHPHSEPVAVVRAPDRKEYLSILVDRKSAPGRPQECTHLEFPKDRCIACIGEDIPEAFLKQLGVHMVVADSSDKKMMAVTPLLETQQPGVFLIGDLLSQAYLETEDFTADPSTFQRIKHRGNIKSSLRDGVFVAEVLKQKLDGRAQIDVVIRDAEDPGAPPARKSAVVAINDLALASEAEAPPAESLPPERRVEEQAHLVKVTAAGIEEDELPLKSNGVTTIGRAGCDLNFPDDTILADNHASITHRDDGYLLRDDGSKTGTFLRLRHGQPRAVAAGDLLRLGRQIIVLHRGDKEFSLQHYDASGKMVGSALLKEGTVVLGRSGGKSNPDIVLAGEDMTLSRFHVSLARRGWEVVAEDFNSRNGTFLKVSNAVEIGQGDEIRVGRQIFRLSLRDAPIKRGSSPTLQMPPAARPSGAKARITFAGKNLTFPIDASQTILEVADEHDVDLDHECWVGKCGCDLIRVLKGREHLNEISEQEKQTIARRGAKAGECRLACMTRVTGPVVVEVVD